MRTIELRAKVWKQGNSLVITIPKQMLVKQDDTVRILTDGNKMEVSRYE